MVDFRSAAVDDDNVDADQLQQDDIRDDGLAQLI